MLRFRCPHCLEVLETEKPSQVVRCPSCAKRCRSPGPKKPTSQVEELQEVVEEEEEEILDVIAVPDDEPFHSRREAVTNRKPDKVRSRRRDEEDEEAVMDLEVVEDDEEDEPAPKRKRRPRRPRRRHRSSSGINVNLALILPLVLFGVPGLGLVVLSFVVFNPVAGIACLLMVVGWIWFTILASEDGLGTVLACMFVPFYALIYTFNNFERVGIPFIIQFIGSIGYMVSTRVDRAAPPPRPGFQRMQSSPAPIMLTMAAGTAGQVRKTIVLYASNSGMGAPHGARVKGRPRRSINSRLGSTPRQEYSVATMSPGVTGLRLGRAPILSLAPWTKPPLKPPPASIRL
jgi:hypothetical protein